MLPPCSTAQGEIASMACSVLEQALIPSPDVVMCLGFFISREFIVGECSRRAWEAEFFW